MNEKGFPVAYECGIDGSNEVYWNRNKHRGGYYI